MTRTGRRPRDRLAAWFDPALRHDVVVPPGADGRPGERLSVPRPTMHPPMPGDAAGEARMDFRVDLVLDGATLGARSVGRSRDGVGPADRAEADRAAFAQRGWTAVAVPGAVAIGGEPTAALRATSGDAGHHAWWLSHAGWDVVVDVGWRTGDGAAALERARRALATWVWL